MIEKTILNNEKEDDIFLFERALYLAFDKISEVQKKIWIIDNDRRRIKPMETYDSLIIYRMKVNDEEAAYLVANKDGKAIQQEKMGFQLPKRLKSNDVCFGVVLFKAMKSVDSIEMLKFVNEYCYRDLLSRGYKTYIGSTTEKFKKMYEMVGWKMCMEQSIDGEKRWLMELDLTRFIK